MYDDIINLPRHISTKHPPMPIADRAAQFGSFAALRGHSDAIEETGRYTINPIDLDEYEKEVINEKLVILSQCNSGVVDIEVTYFVPDNKKTGGKYITTSGYLKKIDDYNKKLIMNGDTLVPIEYIIDINILSES